MVAVKGMEMPKNCMECLLFDDEYGDCNIMGEPKANMTEERAKNCPLVSTILIPEGATNGDMIKALFPKAEFNNAMPFTDGRWETMNLDTENRLRAIYKPTQLRTYADWWNTPYKYNLSEKSTGSESEDK